MLFNALSGVPSLLAGKTAPAPDDPPSLTVARQLINSFDAVRTGRGRLELALNEIRKGKALEYHQTQTSRRVLEPLLDNVLKVSAEDREARLEDWRWFLANGPPRSPTHATDEAWTGRQIRFNEGLKAQVETRLFRFNPTAEVFLNATLNWLQNMPASVHRLIHELSYPEIPPALVYAAAVNEGLVDEYLRRQVPGAGFRLNSQQLASLELEEPVEGYWALGLDTFFTELELQNPPRLATLLPAGFDVSKMKEVTEKNEHGVEVRTVVAPNLRMGMQAMVAMLRRRRALFLQDRESLGYAEPSNLELIYFTYIYYNAGPGDRAHPDAAGDGGFQTLYRHRPGHPDPAQRRVLGDWITEPSLWYRKAMKVLVTYQFVADTSEGHPLIFAGL